MAKAYTSVAAAPALSHDMMRAAVLAPLAEDRTRIENCLKGLVAAATETAWNPVPRAMEYAVMGKAQRIRPILALRVARMLGYETSHTVRAGAAVELIHSASLIIDDLPCMDDEQTRRGKPATHIQFGEPTAILAAFSLVGLAARSVMEGADCARMQRFQMALLKTLDCSALVGGQCLDLSLVGAERDAMRSTVNDLKTVPLFQLAVEAGCVSGRGGVPAELESFGKSFGVAFQLTDDFLDGELHDRKVLEQAYEQCRAQLQPFGAPAEPLHDLLDYLAGRIEN